MNATSTPFRIKICGVTAPDQVARICSTGVDAIGVNFSATSPRGIGAAIARKIAEAKSSSVKLVGVFVNESVERITELVAEVPLDLVQLHGDESWEVYGELAEKIQVYLEPRDERGEAHEDDSDRASRWHLVHRRLIN